jgi:hypothetical protein
VAIKKKSYEKLDSKNIQRVIDALDSEKPITKKEACEMLNISYNTTRLSKIIDNHYEEQAYRKRRMDKNRGKPASKEELQEMIMGYLTGSPVSHIAKQMFRSPGFIKGNLDRIGVPTKVAEGETFIPPDECVKYEFEVGEWVWFNDAHPDAKGGKAGIILKEGKSPRCEAEGVKGYQIQYYVPVEWQEGMWISWWPGIRRFKSHTFKKAYDLASIQHLIDEYGINEEQL